MTYFVLNFVVLYVGITVINTSLYGIFNKDWATAIKTAKDVRLNALIAVSSLVLALMSVISKYIA